MSERVQRYEQRRQQLLAKMRENLPSTLRDLSVQAFVEDGSCIEYVRMAADEIERLRTINADLLALAKRYASECPECFGDKDGDCDGCRHIWAVIHRAEGRSNG